MGWDSRLYVYGDRGYGNWGFTNVGGNKYQSVGYSDNLNGKKYRETYTVKNGKKVPIEFDWQEFNYWSRYHSICRKYTNDTGTKLQYESVGIRSCSGNSKDSTENPDGKFYSWDAGSASMHLRDIPVLGLASTLFVAIRVSNDGGKTWASSNISEAHVDRVNYNMNYRGGPGPEKDSAEFGGGRFYDTPNGLTYQTFEIENCPVLEPGGIMYLHWGIKYAYFNSGETASNGVLRVQFGPDDINIKPKQFKDRYIWIRESDGKWHLKRPSYTVQDSEWTSMDGEEE